MYRIPSASLSLGAGLQSRPLFLPILWAAGVLTVIIYLVASLYDGFSVDSSIMALLPNEDRQPLVEKSSSLLAERFTSSLIFVLRGDTARKNTITSISKQYEAVLIGSGAFKHVNRGLGKLDYDALVPPYLSYRNKLLDDKTRVLVSNGDVKEVVERSVRELVNPFSVPRALPLMEDPFNLFGVWLQSLPLSFRIQQDEDGYFVEERGQYNRVLFAEFSGDPFDVKVQELVMRAVAKADLVVKDEKLEILRSGLLFHAVQGTEQAKIEISTIGLGSLAGILVLIFLIFGQIRILLFAAIPIFIGCLFGLAACLVILGRVHVITLVFGASLVGVSVDYVFHFFCASKVKDNSDSTIKKILPALMLGLGSSVVAYASFAITPFPGLQQMALFAVTGLISTWLTVVLWYPLISPDAVDMFQSRLRMVDRQRRTINFKGLRLRSLVVLLVFTLVLSTQVNVQDDVRMLNTSSEASLNEQYTVQQLLKAPIHGQYYLIEGAKLEQVLQREEQFRPGLDQLVDEGLFDSYQMVSAYLPSVALQEKNLRSINQLYDSEEDIVFFMETLGLQEVGNWRYPGEIDGETNWLTYEKLRSWVVGEWIRQLMIGDPLDGSYGGNVVLLTGELKPGQLGRLQDIAAKVSGVQFVDTPGSITEVLRLYREQMSSLLIIIYIVIWLILSVRFRKLAIFVVATPAIATLSAIIVLMMLGQPLTLFHILAAVLVLGIGLDMGIFLAESNAASHALIAVGASALSTILAFGLLALSQTPVLKYFGQMAMLGISFSLILSFMFLGNYQRRKMYGGL